MTPRFANGRPLTPSRRSSLVRPVRGRSDRRPFHRLLAGLLVPVVALAFAGCQDGEVDDDQVCAFQCDYTDANAALTAQDVVQVIANAIYEAEANNIDDITVVVLDHLSNVLAVFDTDASTTDFSLITSVESPDRTENTPWVVERNGGSADFDEDAPPAPFAAADFDSLQTALDGIFIPAGYAAISKAGTSNYFSTQGNAFSSRTASVLIQENFFPGETDRPGGPLFAVQIAQLVCSDINTRQSVDQITDTTIADDANDLIGPRRLPVGFAADPGGIPLYKDGVPELDASLTPTGRTGKVVVGAVGVEFNGIYGVDRDGTDNNRNLEERIAVGATRGRTAAETFEADDQRKAPRITVAGRALRFADDTGTRGDPAGRPVITAGQAASGAAAAAALNAISGETGAFVQDQFFFPFADPRPGVNFLDPASGVVREVFDFSLIAASNGAEVQTPGLSATGEKLVDRANADRYRATDSVNPAPPAAPLTPALADGLSAADVQELLIQSLLLAENTRAQTRRPLGGQARIDVAVVDLDGTVLGFARSQDALLDGVDVTIAKTRQAAFWSKAAAQDQLVNATDPLGAAGLLNVIPVAEYVNLAADFLGLPSPPPAVTDPPFNGDIAWSSIALGGISGRDFPPGVASGPNGPLARDPDRRTTTTPAAPTDFGEWSIFSTGIQTEIVLPGIALGLCEEVPDLAAALFDLGLGVPPPIGGRPGLFTNAASRATFCGDVRALLIGSPDPGMQLDCMQGVQDGGTPPITGLQNGFHIFQGAVPIYRRDDATGTFNVIGAIGVSGDGAEQDDFVPFVALDTVFQNQSARGLPNPIGNAPFDIRADNVAVQNVNLRYVVCPPAPFLDSDSQNGCEGR